MQRNSTSVCMYSSPYNECPAVVQLAPMWTFTAARLSLYLLGDPPLLLASLKLLVSSSVLHFQMSIMVLSLLSYRESHLDAVKLLCQYKADTECGDEFGLTPLHFACA